VLAVEAKRDYFILFQRYRNKERSRKQFSGFNWTPLTIELILEERSSMVLQMW